MNVPEHILDRLRLIPNDKRVDFLRQLEETLLRLRDHGEAASTSND